MKKRLISLLLTLVMISVYPLSISAEENGVSELLFKDVTEDHVAYEAIEALVEEGVLSGKSEGLFYPEDTLKREEFAKMLCEALDITEGKNSPIFYDVLAGSWYDDYVIKAASNGLINGVSDTHFGIGGEITRQDMAVMLKRYLDKQGVKPTQEVTVLYADNAEISDYAREAVSFLSSLDIIEGRDNNLWCPQSPATRAEAAKAIYTARDAKRLQAASMGLKGGRVQYGPPYEEITGDRLAEAMPTGFDVTKLPRVPLVEEDLEDSDYGRLVIEKLNNAEILTGDGVGYESDSCVLVQDEGVATFVYKGDPGELNKCDFLALTCMMKCEDFQTTTKRGARPIIQVYNDTPQWINEGNSEGVNKNSDWVEVTNIVEIPEVLNALTEPEYYTIKLSLNCKGSTGYIYFDNLRLSKVAFQPMDVVFMDPVYKGIIKGEGGIGDISLRAFINDGNGKYPYSDMTFTARITDEEHNVLLESTSETVTSVMDAHFSSATLPMGGTLWAECILSNKETGEVIHKQEYGVYKREADYKTVIDFDKYGRMTINGEPHIDFQVGNEGGYWNTLVFSDAFDSIGQSRTWWLNYANRSSEPEKDPQIFEQNLREQGKRLTVATGRFTYSALQTSELKEWIKKPSDIRTYIKRMTGNLKDVDILQGYYTWDEANAMVYGSELEWANKLFTHYDPDHPTYSAIANSWEKFPGVYSKMTDVIGYDPYLVTGKEDQDISLVAEEVQEAKALNPNRPILIMSQGIWYTGRGDLREPTYEEFKNMCFQAVMAGISSLTLHSYGTFFRTGSGFEDKSVAQVLADWEQVYRELQHLEPIVLSVLPAPYYEVEGGGKWLDTITRRYDGKSYLFTVNTSKEKNTAKIYLDGAKKIKGLYSGEEYTADQNGYFNLDFDKYEVEVFEYEQADYKSSHAELRNFVAANYTVYNAGDFGIVPATTDTPTIVIDDGAKEMDYRAYMSDYATLYINGEAVHEVGTINIDGVDKLDLKIVSEDGRFTTEKTYLIQRD